MSTGEPTPSKPARFRRASLWAATFAVSLAAGMLSALVLHYILYRIGLPGSPFIYVAF